MITTKKQKIMTTTNNPSVILKIMANNDKNLYFLARKIKTHCLDQIVPTRFSDTTISMETDERSYNELKQTVREVLESGTRAGYSIQKIGGSNPGFLRY